MYIKGVMITGFRNAEEFIAKVEDDFPEIYKFLEFNWIEIKERFYTLNECVLDEWEEITEKEYLETYV